MATIEWVGWAAAAMTLLAFTSRDLWLLRIASLGASIAFIVYATATSTWPVLALHAVLLPINLLRLIELHRVWRPSMRRIGALGTARPEPKEEGS